MKWNANINILVTKFKRFIATKLYYLISLLPHAVKVLKNISHLQIHLFDMELQFMTLVSNLTTDLCNESSALHV